MQKGTIYVKIMPPKQVKDEFGNEKLVEETGQDIINRVISYVENFVSRNKTQEKLDNLIHYTREEELKFIDNEINDFREKMYNKKFDDDFDYVKYNILKSKNMYALNYRPDILYEGADYPEFLQLEQELFDKIMKYNPNVLDDGKILGMKVRISKVSKPKRKINK